MKRIILLKFVLICSFALFIMSCSQEPSKEVIHDAIIKYFESGGQIIPMSWHEKRPPVSTSLGESGKIDELEIVQIGKFNKQNLYWPVRARVKGTCQVLFSDPHTRGPIIPFSGTGNFKIYKDDYGNWKAKLQNESGEEMG